MFRLLGVIGLSVAVIVLGAHDGFGQANAPPDAQPKPKSEGGARKGQKAQKGRSPDDVRKEQAERRRARLWRGPIPDGGAERARLLAELYRQLAKTKNENIAKRIERVIQRVWRTSGSQTVDLLMQRAAVASKKKDQRLAVSLLDRAIDLAPDHPELFLRRAFVYYKEGDIERALGDLRRTLALDPNHFKALDALGDIFRELGRKKAALAVYRKLIKVHPFADGVERAIRKLAQEIEGQET